MTYINGGDISHWQKRFDAAKAKAAGWQFVLCKATQKGLHSFLTKQNSMGCRKGKFVFSRKGRLGYSTPVIFGNYLLEKFNCIRAWMITPALALFVVGIIFFCTQKEVIWVYTSWVITGMTNTHSIGDWSDTAFIGILMCLSVTGGIKVSVPVSILCSSPFPTVIRAAHINLTPKTLFQWLIFLTGHCSPLNRIPPALLPEVSPVRDWLAVYKHYNGLFFGQQSLTGDELSIAQLFG